MYFFLHRNNKRHVSGYSYNKKQASGYIEIMCNVSLPSTGSIGTESSSGTNNHYSNCKSDKVTFYI